MVMAVDRVQIFVWDLHSDSILPSVSGNENVIQVSNSHVGKSLDWTGNL
jgi:hypothetical protein